MLFDQPAKDFTKCRPPRRRFILALHPLHLDHLAQDILHRVALHEIDRAAPAREVGDAAAPARRDPRSRGRTLCSPEPFVIFRVRSDPEPNHLSFMLNGHRAVVKSDADRPEPANLFEVQ